MSGAAPRAIDAGARGNARASCHHPEPGPSQHTLLNQVLLAKDALSSATGAGCSARRGRGRLCPASRGLWPCNAASEPVAEQGAMAGIRRPLRRTEPMIAAAPHRRARPAGTGPCYPVPLPHVHRRPTCAITTERCAQTSRSDRRFPSLPKHRPTRAALGRQHRCPATSKAASPGSRASGWSADLREADLMGAACSGANLCAGAGTHQISGAITARSLRYAIAT